MDVAAPKLAITWNTWQISKHLNITKNAGFQRFAGDHIMDINDTVPVIRIMGGTMALQLMRWFQVDSKALNTKYVRCLVLVDSFKLGNKWFSATDGGYFYITATFAKVQIDAGMFKYYVSVHITKPLDQLKNAGGRYMPAIISKRKAIKYLSNTLSMEEILTADNWNGKICGGIALIGDRRPNKRNIYAKCSMQNMKIPKSIAFGTGADSKEGKKNEEVAIGKDEGCKATTGIDVNLKEKKENEETAECVDENDDYVDAENDKDVDGDIQMSQADGNDKNKNEAAI